MQVTVDIPDEFAARVIENGSTPESYVQGLVSAQIGTEKTLPPPKRLSNEEFNAILDSIAQFSYKIPNLPDEAFTRESIYQDHD